MRRGVLLLIFMAATVVVVRSQDVPLPPKPTDDGLTLEFTMKYIQDRLNAVDIKWTQTGHADAGDIHYEDKYSVASAEADPKGCTIAYQEILRDRSLDTSSSSTDVESFHYSISLRAVANVTVQPRSEFDRRLGFNREYSPAVYALTIKMVPGKALHLQRWRRDYEDRGEATLFLPDEDLAGRLAKALVHAVELCGGGDKDPFK